MPLSRRHFMLGSAGAALATARAGVAWPVQAPRDAAGPQWQPNADLLRHLPRLLELASVPGLALAVVEGGQVWRRGFGLAIEEPAQAVSEETVFEAASLEACTGQATPVRAVASTAPALPSMKWRRLKDIGEAST